MFFSKGLKKDFETAVVNEPSVFEPSKFYLCGYVCITKCVASLAKLLHELSSFYWWWLVFWKKKKNVGAKCRQSYGILSWNCKDHSWSRNFMLFLTLPIFSSPADSSRCDKHPWFFTFKRVHLRCLIYSLSQCVSHQIRDTTFFSRFASSLMLPSLLLASILYGNKNSLKLYIQQQKKRENVLHLNCLKLNYVNSRNYVTRKTNSIVYS